MSSEARPGRGLAAMAAAAASVAVGTTYWVLGVYLPAFNTPNTTAVGNHRAGAHAGPARSATLVVVDGVSFERARAAPSWQPLFEAGVSRPLDAPFPSYTYPAVTALATGVPPRESGVRLNGDIAGPELDSLARAAQDGGLAVRVRSRGWSPFTDLVRPGSAADVRLGRAAAAVETTIRLVTSSGPGRALELIYIGDPDDAAHEHDEDSTEYASAIDAAGLALQRRLRTLDLAHDALVVVSDHGHRRGRGGHGGTEPEVLDALFIGIGAGLSRGEYLPRRRSEDVAPTVALLAGFSAPGASLGRPMLDALDVSDERLGPMVAPQLESLAARACSVASAGCARTGDVLGALRAGAAGASLAADGLAQEVLAGRDGALVAAARDARARRLSVVGGALGLGAVVTTGLGWRRRQPRRDGARSLVAAFGAPFVLIAVYAASMAVRGYRVSFSTLPPMSIFVRDAFLAGGGALAIVLLVLSAAREASDRAAWTLLLAAAVPYALLATWVGAEPGDVVPPIEGALVFFAAPIVATAAAGAVAVALLGRRARR